MEQTDTTSSQQQMPPPAPVEFTPPSAAPASETHSFSWVALIVLALILIAGALYWIAGPMVPASQPSPQTPSAAAAAELSMETDAVASELEGLSTDGLDAELEQIDRELAQ